MKIFGSLDLICDYSRHWFEIIAIVSTSILAPYIEVKISISADLLLLFML